MFRGPTTAKSRSLRQGHYRASCHQQCIALKAFSATCYDFSDKTSPEAYASSKFVDKKALECQEIAIMPCLAN